MIVHWSTDGLSTMLGVDDGLTKEGKPPWVWMAPTNRLAAWMEQKGTVFSVKPF